MSHLINRHMSGSIIVFTSITLQIVFWLYKFIYIEIIWLKIGLIICFPIYFLISSFFVFYSVNLFYNIIVPPKWIEQNSQFLSFIPLIQLNTDYYSNNQFNAIIDDIIDDKLEYPFDMLEHSISIYTEKTSKMEKSSHSSSSSSSNSINISPHSCISNDGSFLYTHDHIMEEPSIMITIQIPVYTEDFEETLLHTFDNVKRFVHYYNTFSNNHKVNVLIHEDGLQKVSDDEKCKRIQYYNSFKECFYIARSVNGRTGKFKKASNMNFGLRQILKINNSDNIYNKDDEWRSQSIEFDFLYKTSNASQFQIGKYILLIDSDSKFNPLSIPSLIYEMEMSPNIGYIQVRTNSAKVVKTTWENAISHFTNSIYDINFLYSCSNGFPAPLVGHNVLLRWSALQSVEKLLNGYGYTNYNTWSVWDETRVSEDFVMSIYLQYLGYYGKYVFYDCGFKEGVSLNIIDEITKLKKYIYGINEIMFYPCNQWLSHGIFSHLYVNFLLSDKITFSTKYALLAYMGSYYSLALSPFVTIWYYFLKFFKLYNSNLFLMNSLDTIYSCAFVFFGMSILTNILIKLKHSFIQKSIIEIVFKECLYGIYLTMFYSCISLHLLSMMFAYFCGLPAKWETTKKESEKIYITTIIQNYKYMYIIGTGFIILIIYGIVSDGDYQNKEPKSVIPLFMLLLSHLLFPMYTTLYY